jgi:hypothetical protein
VSKGTLHMLLALQANSSLSDQDRNRLQIPIAHMDIDDDQLPLIMLAKA